MNGVVKRPSDIALDDVIFEDEAYPLIPPGEYSVQYRRHETAMVFGTPKVFVRFQVVEPGKCLGVELFRPFRAKALIGKPGRNGRFKLGRRSELFLELCRVYERRRIRPDRVSLRDLSNMILRVSVRTVDKDYRQRPLPEMAQYSVVGEIIDVEVGGVP